MELKSGQSRQGVIEEEDDRQIRFLEIRRPEGRGAYGVHLALPLSEVSVVERLSSAERAESRRRFDEYCNRCRIEALRMEDLTLETAGEVGEPQKFKYAGEWFTLESTADEELTRRAAVRVEQVFSACRQLVPPRLPAPRRPRVLLFGTLAEYRAYLQRIGVPADHAAIYSTGTNTVATGADLARLAEQLAGVREQHRALRIQLDRLTQEVPERLRTKKEQLETAAGAEASRRRALLNFKRQVEEELADQQKQLDAFDRKNDALFEDQTNHTFALLNHEAFHAYLESFVLPGESQRVPRWLNEGLAQVCESGVWEGAAFRIDLPNKPALALLQDDLRSRNSLPLADVLTADHRWFLVTHGGGVEASQRYYAYSWGLAHYLAIHQPTLRSEGFDRFLQGKERGLTEQQRFELLVGRPLADFEKEWRQAMLDLKPAR